MGVTEIDRDQHAAVVDAGSEHDTEKREQLAAGLDDSDGSEVKQEGVAQVEAITTVWSTRMLWTAFVLYVRGEKPLCQEPYTGYVLIILKMQPLPCQLRRRSPPVRPRCSDSLRYIILLPAQFVGYHKHYRQHCGRCLSAHDRQDHRHLGPC